MSVSTFDIQVNIRTVFSHRAYLCLGLNNTYTIFQAYHLAQETQV